MKPANILVTKAGIKLLDFGLAKSSSAGTGQAANWPSDATLTMALTGKNEIVGTLCYMSPFAHTWLPEPPRSLTRLIR